MIRIQRFGTSACVFAILSIAAALPAQAASEGKTAQGLAYASGGVSLGEREMLDKRRGEFNFRLVTAAKKSGAFMADVQIVITDKAGKKVPDTRLQGPWLMARLEPGEYKVEARHAQQAASKSTRIHKGEPREMFFYFDVDAEVLPADGKR